jgi:hypothetical protein
MGKHLKRRADPLSDLHVRRWKRKRVDDDEPLYDDEAPDRDRIRSQTEVIPREKLE